MGKKSLVIIGMSKTASHLYSFIKYHGLFNVVGFAVDEKYLTKDTFHGLPTFSIEELDEKIDKDNTYLFIAMLWNRLNQDRRKIYERLKEKGFKYANVISPTAIIRSEIKGDNCWIHDYTIIQNEAKIKNNVMIMAQTLVGANTTIESHCFLGAKSTIGGGSRIGEQSFIGINSTIFDDTKIGNKCIVGACTAVKRNMPNYTLHKTSSENTTMKQYSESEIEKKLLYKKNVR